MRHTKIILNPLGWLPWIPVLLFAVYWTVALTVYHLGPIDYPYFSVRTYVYITLSLFCFFGAYKVGLGRLVKRTPEEISGLAENFTYVPFWLKLTSVSAVIGVIGLITDRIISGAGSIDQTINDSQGVRNAILENSSLSRLTTISNLFYLPFFIALALYMYCLMLKWKLPKWVHACVLATVIGGCFLAFLGAERQPFLYAVEYVFFYIFFLKRERLSRIVFDPAYRTLRIFISLFLVVSATYIFFIARNRSSDGYLEYLAQVRWAQRDRYELLSDGNFFTAKQAVSAFLISSYMTDQLEITDAFCGIAEPLSFNPGLLGNERVWFQVQRFDHEYQPDAYKMLEKWETEVGDDTWENKWKSIFGANLAMFGYVGSVFFMAFLGLIFGHMVRQSLLYANPGSVVISFCLFLSLTASYEGFYVDIFHVAGYGIGLILYVVGLSFRPKDYAKRQRQTSEALNTTKHENRFV